MTSAVVGPARIGRKPKLLSALAALVTWCVTLAAGALVAVYAVLLVVDPAERAHGMIWWLLFAAGLAAAGVVLGQLLILAALGRRRTGGGLARFARYQLCWLGVGAAIGLGFSPGATRAEPLGWIAGIAGAVALLAVSLPLLRRSKRRPLPDPPPAGTAIVPGTIVEHWWGVLRLASPPLSLVEYADEWGRLHRATHLFQDGDAGLGVTGRVWIRRDRPDRPLRFASHRG